MPDSDNTHRSDSDTALAAMRQRDAELMTRYGWGAHALTDAPLIHTHGRPEGFHHPDLEMRLAISPQKRHELLTILAEALKAGKRFYPGDEDTTLFSVSVRFIAWEESGRIVVRGSFPIREADFPMFPTAPPNGPHNSSTICHDRRFSSEPISFMSNDLNPVITHPLDAIGLGGVAWQLATECPNGHKNWEYDPNKGLIWNYQPGDICW